MANERGHPKLSYEVQRINFHPQVAKENQLFPFKLFLPRTVSHLGTGACYIASKELETTRKAHLSLFHSLIFGITQLDSRRGK